MFAAVVRNFGAPPRYEEFVAPLPAGAHEEVVDVLASGLHPRVRSQADGSHYTATDELPLIPGIDGVGRRTDGSLVYFILPDTIYGAMAQQTVINNRRSITLPGDANPALIAAAMNPAMSSWIALKARIKFEPGQSVLILGATGSAGQLAIQVAKHLGAGEIVAAGRGAGWAAGRGAERLAALGATSTIDLAADPDTVAADIAAKSSEVDVVLDYLWGPPTQAALMPLLRARRDPGKLLSWVEIGSVAGADIVLPSAALRQANIHFLGSGQGSASAAGILATLPSLVDEVLAGTFALDVVTRPLAKVETVWGEPAGALQRAVFVTGH
jgi:NADPH:quinone reductase-like Zn-dependent oxidoreductase